ncbi:hypothetical protein ACOSQ3_007543 [Xanthoceras sorbifolium]
MLVNYGRKSSGNRFAKKPAMVGNNNKTIIGSKEVNSSHTYGAGILDRMMMGILALEDWEEFEITEVFLGVKKLAFLTLMELEILVRMMMKILALENWEEFEITGVFLAVMVIKPL